MARYFKNPELHLYLKLANETFEKTDIDAQDKGLALRVYAHGEERRFESYTFGNRTKQYITDGLVYGNVIEISVEEFKSAATKFLTWANNQITNNFMV